MMRRIPTVTFDQLFSDKDHAHDRKRLSKIYSAMKQRCLNKNNAAYRLYGGKGVKICEEWSTFVGFAKWACANGYMDGMTIDRIDSNGDYEPGNCQWITRGTNSSKVHRSPDPDIEKKAQDILYSKQIRTGELKSFCEMLSRCGIIYSIDRDDETSSESISIRDRRTFDDFVAFNFSESDGNLISIETLGPLGHVV